MVGGKIDENLRKDFFKAWTRIRGGFNADRHKQLIADIRDDIYQLCKLTKGAIDLEDANLERARSANSTYWLDIRNHTHRLYSTLCSIWPNGCSSHTHRAKLRLDMPKGGEGDGETPQLNVSFLLDNNGVSLKSSSWEWRGVTVLSFETPDPQ